MANSLERLHQFLWFSSSDAIRAKATTVITACTWIAILIFGLVPLLGFILPQQERFQFAIVSTPVQAVAIAVLTGCVLSGLLPKISRSEVTRIYFIIVYGILLPWFAVCYAWWNGLRLSHALPADLSLKAMDILLMCGAPPLAGMSVDLLIAKWISKHYRVRGRQIGIVLLVLAMIIVLPRVVAH